MNNSRSLRCTPATLQSIRVLTFFACMAIFLKRLKNVILRHRISRIGISPAGNGFSICLASAVAVALLLGRSAQAASQTWSGGSVANGNWGTPANWVGGAAPRSTSITNSADIATFNAAIANTWGNTSGNPIAIDSTTQNISSISFDTNAGNYFIGSTGGNSLRMSTLGNIQILSTLLGSNKTFTVNAPLIIGAGTLGVSLSLTNNASDATNTLVLGGQISGGSTSASTTLNLSGVNTGRNTISGNIINGAGTVGVTKSGAGTWVLTGADTYTGVTAVTGGTLILDMNAGGSLASTSALTLGLTSAGTIPSNGKFQINGANGSSSTQTLGNLSISGNSTIKLTPGASGGTVNLTLGNTWSRAGISGGALNIDLSAGNSTVTSNVALTNSLIAGLTNSAAYATVTDATGTGFATVNGSGNVVRFTGATALTFTTTASSSGTNYITSGGKLLAASDPVNTLQLDTSAAGDGTGILDLNSKILILTAKAILVTGAGNITIQNGQLGSNSNEVNIQQFATGTLTISASIGGGGAGTAPITKDGPGTLILTGVNVTTGNYTLNGGVLRAADGTGLSSNSLLVINNGVFETGAANFTRTLGAGSGNVEITSGTSGFSANGGAVNISIGGVGTETALTWGNTNFNPAALVLNEVTANNTLNFKNAIDLNGANRTVNVNAAGANTATISGVISSTGGGGLIKGGVGTLVLSASNSYTGATIISGGTLALTSALSNNIASSSQINLGSGAGLNVNGISAGGGFVVPVAQTLSGFGTVTGAATINGALTPGTHSGGGVLTFASGLTIGSGATLNYGLGTGSDLVLVTGNLALNGPVVLNVTQLGGLSTGTAYDLFNYTGTLSGSLNLANWTAVNAPAGTTSTVFKAVTVGGTNEITVTFNAGAAGTTYTLAASAANQNVLVGTAASVASIITNTGSSGSDTLNYSGLTVTVSGSASIGGSTGSGTALALGASGTNTGPTFTASASGTYAVTPVVSGATNTTSGSNATLSSATAVTMTAYNRASLGVSQSGTNYALANAAGTYNASALVSSNNLSNAQAGFTNVSIAGTQINAGSTSSPLATFNGTGMLNGTYSATSNINFSDVTGGGGAIVGGSGDSAHVGLTATITGYTAQTGSAQILSGGGYQGYSLTNSTGNQSMAILLGGTASATTTVKMDFSNPNGRPTSGASGKYVSSDVLTLTGINAVGGTNPAGSTKSDQYVIEVTFGLNANVGNSATSYYLGWYDASLGQWVNAIAGNSNANLPADYFGPGEAGQSGTYFNAAYDSTTMNQLGDYGSYLSGGVYYAWAVVNYDADFAVIPEPSTWGMTLGGFGMLVGIQRLRRRRVGT